MILKSGEIVGWPKPGSIAALIQRGSGPPKAISSAQLTCAECHHCIGLLDSGSALGLVPTDCLQGIPRPGQKAAGRKPQSAGHR